MVCLQYFCLIIAFSKVSEQNWKHPNQPDANGLHRPTTSSFFRYVTSNADFRHTFSPFVENSSEKLDHFEATLPLCENTKRSRFLAYFLFRKNDYSIESPHWSFRVEYLAR